MGLTFFVLCHSGHETPRCCVPSLGVEGLQMELGLRARGPSLVRLHGLMFPIHLGVWNGGPEPPQRGPHLPVRLFCTEFGRQPGNFWKVYGPGQAVQTCLPPRAEPGQVVPRQMQRRAGGERGGRGGGGGSSRRKEQLQEASHCRRSSSQGRGRMERRGQRAQGPHVDTHVKHTHTPKHLGTEIATQVPRCANA